MEYAIEVSAGWKIVDVSGAPCDGVNVAREDYKLVKQEDREGSTLTG